MFNLYAQKITIFGKLTFVNSTECLETVLMVSVLPSLKNLY